MANFNNGNNENQKIGYQVIEHIGVIEVEKSGWTKEVNIVNWNNHGAKLDIRSWDPEHTKMAKGLTFTEKGAYKLTKLLFERFPDACPEDEEEEDIPFGAEAV